ncbi:methylated-DNA--[protein]-cysteine S-methyltransferase [Saliterribacillus persicus]|uniref:Methylated-DNA--protein-cysteine methyltransferase n=1 Tax=Saliterribacillus persicus TaxID=930114 RepID=A0A368Y9J9_9BACI|nr:methylated-DNA--[protein]-cysteine S-methyltransferase [Saliterribacillus persicus]RCW74864.1 methylated-DNA-[protein]-cysteine S-methyltransferase [Saliterribacillus persicus]
MPHKDLIFCDELETPIGDITVIFKDYKLVKIAFGKMDDTLPSITNWCKKHTLATDIQKSDAYEIKQQLIDYFNGAITRFDLALDLCGTPFQKKVWKVLENHVNYGMTWSYKQVAEKLGAPNAVRAVGGAVNKNPIPIIIPCHRIIGSNGALVGYAGGLDKKKSLLEIEKTAISFAK